MVMSGCFIKELVSLSKSTELDVERKYSDLLGKEKSDLNRILELLVRRFIMLI